MECNSITLKKSDVLQWRLHHTGLIKPSNMSMLLWNILGLIGLSWAEQGAGKSSRNIGNQGSELSFLILLWKDHWSIWALLLDLWAHWLIAPMMNVKGFNKLHFSWKRRWFVVMWVNGFSNLDFLDPPHCGTPGRFQHAWQEWCHGMFAGQIIFFIYLYLLLKIP